MAGATDTETPLLLTDKKPLVRAISADDNIPTNVNESSSTATIRHSKSNIKLKKSKSSKIPDTYNLVEQKSNALAQESIGNLTFLQNRWTDVKENSSFIKWLNTNPLLVKSKRKDCKTFTGVNAVWDAIRYGYCKSPKMNYNPYVRTSLIRAAVSDESKIQRNDTDEPDDEDIEDKKELETVRTTLPVYNGGNHVRVRKCDRNTHIFPLKKQEWITSWLSFDVSSDKIMTAADDFIGAVSINLTGIKKVGQTYYTQLPLINKKNYSKQIQIKAEQEYERKLARVNVGGHSKLDMFKEKLGYNAVQSEETETHSDSDDDRPIKNERIDKDLNITGVLHVKATKKLRAKKDIQDTYDLEIEILAITNLTTLKMQQGMDNRSFYGGILGFILYLLFYAMVMFVAEIDTSTGMNEYKESIWFALITVTTLGYGDIFAQTPYSKVLNGLFITINVILIAGFVSSLLGYVVDAGEEALDHRLDHMMNGAQGVLKHQQEAEHAKLKKHITRKQLLLSDDGKQRARSHSTTISKNDLKKIKHKRSQSEPENRIENVELKVIEEEEKKQEQIEKAVEEAKVIEVVTAKATKLKLYELTKLDDDEKTKFSTQIWVNIVLFILVVLFGFFTLGVAILLTGPNYLTSLPYFGYDCQDVAHKGNEFCKLDMSAGAVFVDSLYYTVVSMTTVGYGDIYPKPGAGARILGALFVLFGTLMLVRLLDLVSDYMIWKQNVQKKKRNLGKLLTSSAEFFAFDLDNSGTINKYEFLIGMLIKLDIVDMERIDEIMLIFHKTDIDGNGFVDSSELKQKISEDHMKLKWGEDAWKEINREWNSIKHEQEKIKIENKKLKLKLEKFEKEKKQWEKQKRKFIKQIENESKEECEEPHQIINNDINIAINNDNESNKQQQTDQQ